MWNPISVKAKHESTLFEHAYARYIPRMVIDRFRLDTFVLLFEHVVVRFKWSGWRHFLSAAGKGRAL